MRTDFSTLRKEKRVPLVRDSGSFWPDKRCSSGLGSNSSIWLAPPARKIKMQRRARGAKCGVLGARGLTFGAGAAKTPSSCRSEARAARPRPLAELVRNARRLARAADWGTEGSMEYL